MNEKPAYEQLITDKLNRLPVPDMADVIWARIEAQLDIDMPTDDGSGGDHPAPQAPSGGGGLLGGIGMFIGIVALVTFFILHKNNRQNTVQPNIKLPATEIMQPAGTPPGKAPPDNSRTGRGTGPKEKVLSLPLLPAPDSTVASAVPNAFVDSTIADHAPAGLPPAVTAVTSAGDTTVPKKKRGVPLNDADYRIVPKKDSLP